MAPRNNINEKKQTKSCRDYLSDKSPSFQAGHFMSKGFSTSLFTLAVWVIPSDRPSQKEAKWDFFFVKGLLDKADSSVIYMDAVMSTESPSTKSRLCETYEQYGSKGKQTNKKKSKIKPVARNLNVPQFILTWQNTKGICSGMWITELHQRRIHGWWNLLGSLSLHEVKARLDS